jgi:hypothetical protein
MDNREKALNFLENSVKSAFAKGLKATIGDFDYVFLNRGQEVEVGENVMAANEAGIFQKTPVQALNRETNQYETTHYTYLHYGREDQLRSILDHLCRDMSVHQIDMAMVGVTGHSVLSENSRKRRVGSEDALSI